jgi:valyl-tRNA synthetase
MLTTFPTGDVALIDEVAESEMSSLIELITKVRNIRAEMNIKSGDRLAIHIAGDNSIQSVFAANEAQIKKLARADKIVLAESLDVPKASARAVLTGNAEIAVPLEGLIDFEKERERLQNQLEKLDVELQRLNSQLSNADFVEKAPAQKVDELRTRQSEINTQIATLGTNIEALA